MNKFSGSAYKIYHWEYKLHSYLHLLLVSSQGSTNHILKSLHFTRKHHKLLSFYTICKGNTSFNILQLYRFWIWNLQFQNLLTGCTDNNIVQALADLIPFLGHSDTTYWHKNLTQDATPHFLTYIFPISRKPMHNFTLQCMFSKLTLKLSKV